MSKKYNGGFYKNVKEAIEAEEIVRQLLIQLFPGKKFNSVHDEEEYFHRGDILCDDGQFYEVKDDSVIHRTGNVFCEEKKFWFDGSVSNGWMRNGEYDNLCILDQVNQRLYILDFKKLKKIYKQGKFIITRLKDNRTSGYCLPLRKIREAGAMIYETHYTYDASWDCYDVDLEQIEKR